MKIFNLNEIKPLVIKEIFNKDVVVIPTETVYGLAGRIDNDEILRKIYLIKGRPSDNPLIIHISNIEMCKKYIDENISNEYLLLIKKFWPGPLTLLFKASKEVSEIVRGNSQTTVAIRMPQNKHLRNLIENVGVPLAAPSANTSGKPSPTKLEHVMNDLGNNVNFYIDDGPCNIGLESTVFGIINGIPTLLRPGHITKEEIEKELGCEIFCKNKIKPNEKVMSPGIKYRHYSPNIPVYLFIGDDWDEKMKNFIINIKKSNKLIKFGLLEQSKNKKPVVDVDVIYYLGDGIKEACKNCFDGLIYLENKCDFILVREFNKENEGLAIMDRLEKSSTKII